MEDQELDTGFADFMAGLDEDYGNQTDPVETDTPDSGAETDIDEQPDGGDAGTQEGDDSQQQPAEEPGEAENPETPAAEPTEETFTIKVNKEERTCTRDEMISLAQKGADYDRIREKLNGQQEAMDLLAEMAKDGGTDIPGLLDSFRLDLLKKQGLSEDVAKERLARQKLEKENAALKAEKSAAAPKAETAKERAQRELADFRKVYPKVDLTEDLMAKLMPDIKNGVSMTEAYRNFETAEKDARIAELELQLSAQKQNAANHTSSPGSQKDSGGRRTKSDFDDFMRALQ